MAARSQRFRPPLRVAKFLISVLCHCFGIVAGFAKSLPIVPIPEQFPIPSVGDDMIHNRCLHITSFGKAPHTKRMGLQVNSPSPSASGSRILSRLWSSCRVGAEVCVPHSTWCRREPACHSPDVCTGCSAYVAWYPRPLRFRSTTRSMPRIAPSSSPARICPLIVRYCCTVSSGFFFFRYDNAARIFSVSIRFHSLLCTDG